MKIRIKKSVVNLGILMFLFINFSHGVAQSNTLFDLGEKLITIAKSDNADKILDLIDDKLDLDQKAQIMESFLTLRTQIFTLVNKDKIQLFNVLKKKANLYIILFDGQRFGIIKNKINDSDKLVDQFTMIDNDLSKTLAEGKKIYKERCYSCHGKFAQGGIGSNLTDNYWKYVNSEQDLFDLIKNGKKGTMMLSFNNYLKPEEIKKVIIYIKALQNRKQNKPKKPEGEMKNIDFSL